MRAEQQNRDIDFPERFGGPGVAPFVPRVRIVGGGLTGVLAALQAHRMGAREIELHERLDRLGGVALPEMRDGCEMREGCIYFGPESDPIRSLLEEHGARFEEFNNRFGSVAKSASGLAYLDDFGGPVLPSSDINLNPLGGSSLADRLGCYAADIREPLARYVEWHTGCTPAELHEDAAIPLAINRIFPGNADIEALSDAKRHDPLANELFGIPRSMWGYTSNTKASLPAGGFIKLIDQCRSALEAIGVRINERSLANPRSFFDEGSPDDVIVWAASPMPLFKTVGIAPPRAPARKFVTKVFKAQWTGAAPFYVQNFTADGSCFRVYIYESGGTTLLTAECVSQHDGETLERDIHAMLDGFAGELTLGEELFRSVKPRWLYHSTDTIDKLGALRTALKAKFGARFVTGAWEAYAKGEKFAQVEAELQTAMTSEVALGAL